VGHRSATITTAAPGRHPAGGAAQDRGGEGVLRLGPVAEAFITDGAAVGCTRLPAELAGLNTLRAAHGEEAFAAALDRAVAFSRWRAADVRSILGVGAGLPPRRPPAARSSWSCQPSRSCRCPSTRSGAVMTAAPPPLAPDLAAGLRQVKLAAMRQLAPELLITARDPAVGAGGTAAHADRGRAVRPGRLQRQGPDEEAAFPVIKAPDELDRSASSIPGPTLHYLASLEWITAPENLCLVGPVGTGKSQVLVSLGVAAVRAGRKVRHFTAADLADTLYRGLADNSVGKVIEALLRNDLVLVDEVGLALLDDTGAQLLFRFISAAYAGCKQLL
jgi:hypothetical protein